jgi:hypothetical protein
MQWYPTAHHHTDSDCRRCAKRRIEAPKRNCRGEKLAEPRPCKAIPQEFLLLIARKMSQEKKRFESNSAGRMQSCQLPTLSLASRACEF